MAAASSGAARRKPRQKKAPTTDERSTRDRSLDVAEALFAEHGYEGVSLREISRQANADLALIKYHFGDKLQLFESVLTRRVEAMGADRLAALDACRMRWGGTPPPIEDVVDAFMRPFLVLSKRGGRGWKAYMQLVAKISVHPQWAPVLSRLFDPTARHFLSAMRMALPHATEAQIQWSYQLMLSNLLFVFAETGRIDLLSNGLCRSSDRETAYEHMTRYVIGGIKACTSVAHE